MSSIFVGVDLYGHFVWIKLLVSVLIVDFYCVDVIKDNFLNSLKWLEMCSYLYCD